MHIIGKITAKWCGFCVKMEPEWKKFVETKLKGTHYIVKEIDSETEDRDIADINKAYGVILKRNKYPTIFSIHGKKVEYYTGDRTVAGFSTMMKPKHTGGSRYRRRSRRTRKIRKTRRRQN